ncbi:MAG: hypothetical protein KatS3mg031_1164 [Chitinophagales bacterium]|nr:MAG: hypothetical protein KatS3mg031_1164 [Chitinophagales bacterium]
MHTSETSSITSFAEINAIIEAIPERTFGGSQPEFLFHLLLNLQVEGEVVEIGTNVGKSTIALAFAQKVKNGRPIHTIDIFQHPAIEQNLQRAGVSQYVNRIISPSHVAAKQWNKPVKLLWIDGDHSYRGVVTDIKNWSKFVVEGGLIALHDYPGHYGSKVVFRAIADSVLMDPFQYRILHDREAGSIIVFQKLQQTAQSLPSRNKIRDFIYWKTRNLRAWIIETFPGFAQKLIRKIKE